MSPLAWRRWMWRILEAQRIYIANTFYNGKAITKLPPHHLHIAKYYYTANTILQSSHFIGQNFEKLSFPPPLCFSSAHHLALVAVAILKAPPTPPPPLRTTLNNMYNARSEAGLSSGASGAADQFSVENHKIKLGWWWWSWDDSTIVILFWKFKAS